jgi:hypothetical protein
MQNQMQKALSMKRRDIWWQFQEARRVEFFIS